MTIEQLLEKIREGYSNAIMAGRDTPTRLYLGQTEHKMLWIHINFDPSLQFDARDVGSDPYQRTYMGMQIHKVDEPNHIYCTP